MLVRRLGKTAFESRLCSKGAKTLTSLAVGFKVPTRAMTKSGQNPVSKAYPIPESTISIVAPIRSITVRRRCAIRPMAKVAQQHRGGEHAYLKGADSEARQIDRYQNANESVAK